MANNVELLKQYKELLDQGILTQEEFEAKRNEVLAQMVSSQEEQKPEQQAAPSQQNVNQNNAQQRTYQQSPLPGSLESVISTAKTLGILSIIGACTITLGGLICGIIGLLKVKDLDVPDYLVEQRDSAKRLNTIGIAIAAILTVLAFILICAGGCSSGYYY